MGIFDIKNIMKKITGIAALAFMFFAGMSNLNAQELRNSSGNSTGKIESNGTIRNGSGNSVGKIDSDGTIRNGSGNSIGKIDSDGTIRNGSGNSFGKVDSDGTVSNGLCGTGQIKKPMQFAQDCS